MDIKSVAIVGTAESYNQAPFHDKSVQIWGVAGLWIGGETIERLDTIFEMHPKRWWALPTVQGRLAEFDGPVFM